MVHHGAGLRTILEREGVAADARDALLGALADDHGSAELTVPDRAMLDYAVKLTRAPWEVGEADVDALRAAGFSDRAIHDICAIAAYFAFVNRIADGLGVDLEERFDE